MIFITARTRLEDKVRGFKLGADDYITKPFELAELTARVEAVLRRYGKSRDKIAVCLLYTSELIGNIIETILKCSEYDLTLNLFKIYGSKPTITF